ncbi:MAG: SIMPL domain-containing protein [Nanoarchaeota archaeon]|nr:SIMPL domain-containing protein [Nanoarchaeota archaeon]
MKTKIILLLMISLLLLGCGKIDVEELEKARLEREFAKGIKVPKITGTGEVLTLPDYAMIYVRAGAGGDSEYQAIRRAENRINLVKDFLIESGVKESNIEIEGLKGAYWDTQTTRFVTTPFLSARVDDMENLRTYLDSIVGVFAEVRVEFELTDESQAKANKEAFKLAEEDAKAQGATTAELLFASRNFDVRNGKIRKYPETSYAYSVEKTIEEAKNVDLTPKPTKTTARVAVMETIDPKDIPDYPGN